MSSQSHPKGEDPCSDVTTTPLKMENAEDFANIETRQDGPQSKHPSTFDVKIEGDLGGVKLEPEEPSNQIPETPTRETASGTKEPEQG